MLVLFAFLEVVVVVFFVGIVVRSIEGVGNIWNVGYVWNVWNVGYVGYVWNIVLFHVQIIVLSRFPYSTPHRVQQCLQCVGQRCVRVAELPFDGLHTLLQGFEEQFVGVRRVSVLDFGWFCLCRVGGRLGRLGRLPS